MLPRFTPLLGLLIAAVLGVPLLAQQEKTQNTSPAKADEATPNAAPSDAEKKPELTEAERAEARRNATKAITEARTRMAAYKTLTADILETVTVGSRPFKAVGRYVQGTNDRLRLEFSVKIGNEQTGSLTQVSNGQLLWTRWNIGNQSSITRRDIQEIRKALQQNQGTVNTKLMADLGLGGLKALMAALEDGMDFDSIRETEIDGKKFLIVTGQWKESVLGKLGLKRDSPEMRSQEQIPDSVRVFLEADRYFPRRIMYLKRHPQEDLVRPLVTLDLLNVKLNPAVSDAEFDYEPPEEVPQVDDTREFIERAIGKPSAPAGQ